MVGGREVEPFITLEPELVGGSSERDRREDHIAFEF